MVQAHQVLVSWLVQGIYLQKPLDAMDGGEIVAFSFEQDGQLFQGVNKLLAQPFPFRQEPRVMTVGE